MFPSHLTRRESLRLGLLGLSLPALWQQRALARSRAPQGRTLAPRAKSCILLFCWGGPSQLETFDLKPAAPAEVRGDFKPIATSVPGIQISEHLPLLAKQADRLAIVRSMHHDQNVHMKGACFMLTGQMPPEPFTVHAGNWPTLGSMVSYLKPGNPALPRNIAMPYRMDDAERLFFAGQHAGFLGPGYQPFIYTPPADVLYKGQKPPERVVSLPLEPAVVGERLDERRALLETLEEKASTSPSGHAYRKHFERAMNLLSDPKVRDAFKPDVEPERVKERYSKHIAGRTLLTARRLVEAGVPLVTVVCGDQNAGSPASWDTHGSNSDRLKNVLLPPLDRGASALLEDLAERGMLDETLVVIAGEFGRTPKPTGNGRDHWPGVFSVAFAGGGVQGGQVYGRSDAIAAFPADNPVSPGDFIATILFALGIDPHAEMRDKLDRPVAASTGKPLERLFS
jgi:hypothetical protein